MLFIAASLLGFLYTLLNDLGVFTAANAAKTRFSPNVVFVTVEIVVRGFRE